MAGDHGCVSGAPDLGRVCQPGPMVVISGGWVVNVLIILGMLVLIAFAARAFWQTMHQPDDED